MSEKFEQVKKFYGLGLWNERKLRDAVLKGWITAEEYTQITGEDYE